MDEKPGHPIYTVVCQDENGVILSLVPYANQEVAQLDYEGAREDPETGPRVSLYLSEEAGAPAKEIVQDVPGFGVRPVA